MFHAESRNIEQFELLFDDNHWVANCIVAMYFLSGFPKTQPHHSRVFWQVDLRRLWPCCFLLGNRTRDAKSFVTWNKVHRQTGEMQFICFSSAIQRDSSVKSRPPARSVPCQIEWRCPGRPKVEPATCCCRWGFTKHSKNVCKTLVYDIHQNHHEAINIFKRFQPKTSVK